ncbi:Hsp20/alpha crystallin family protein [Pseudonocardia sp. C8]|uniref:Hsp20/alpha crystallin family protein n=1 Tax=Pseudonocardia sp. C8 TaxID=2762759 RepID=UPI0016432EE2|nr:Hsp20/alpha crystallin family protein [Pseudonocardia sp. C8]MBC3189802.1 Hsp20/alpha crystallin family protein [Pseudonocardia sp. C8]
MPHRHDPLEGVTDLFTELHRLREMGSRGREKLQEEGERTHASAWVPTTDIFAVDGRLVIRIELAGVEPDDVDLRFDNGVLTVSGARALDFGDEPTLYVRERCYGEFRRSITLPGGTRREQIDAEFGNGLVEIVVEGIGQQSDATRIELSDRSDAAAKRPRRSRIRPRSSRGD